MRFAQQQSKLVEHREPERNIASEAGDDVLGNGYIFCKQSTVSPPLRVTWISET
jgi:hypothetical protein